MTAGNVTRMQSFDDDDIYNRMLGSTYTYVPQLYGKRFQIHGQSESVSLPRHAVLSPES